MKIVINRRSSGLNITPEMFFRFLKDRPETIEIYEGEGLQSWYPVFDEETLASRRDRTSRIGRTRTCRNCGAENTPAKEIVIEPQKSSVEQLREELISGVSYERLEDGWFWSTCYDGVAVKDLKIYKFIEDSVERNDPYLVKMVEELEMTKDEDNELKVIEIPDDVKWIIGSADGSGEWVEERHRIWS